MDSPSFWIRLDRFLYSLLMAALAPWGRAKRLFCSCCGRIVLPEESLCTSCLERLDSDFAMSEMIEHPLLPGVTLRYLYEWIPGESDFLSVALTSLKGGTQKRSWKKLARAFMMKHAGSVAVQLGSRSSGEVVIIPVPSQLSGKDHAAHFAEGFADLLNSPIMAVPRPENSPEKTHSETTPQKHRSRQQRLKRLPTVKEQRSHRIHLPPCQGQNFVLVDDILTTGSTTFELAAKMGWPWTWVPVELRPRLEIWVLAHRSRLAP